MMKTLKNFGGKKIGGVILIAVIVIAFGFGGFGGGFSTFAAKVLPSPLFPWQALQCLKKMSRPVSESTGSAKAIEEENKHISKPRHQLFNLINLPHSPLIRGEVL